eukprot:1193468-Prorocentrum_minimum.AAC.1
MTYPLDAGHVRRVYSHDRPIGKGTHLEQRACIYPLIDTRSGYLSGYLSPILRVPFEHVSQWIDSLYSELSPTLRVPFEH